MVQVVFKVGDKLVNNIHWNNGGWPKGWKFVCTGYEPNGYGGKSHVRGVCKNICEGSIEAQYGIGISDRDISQITWLEADKILESLEKAGY